MNKLPCSVPQNIAVRNFAKLVREQDPEEVRNMPVFQYAPDSVKKKNRVYLWGNAICGALGNPSFTHPPPRKDLLRTMHRPWRFPFADTHKVVEISCGYGFTVMAGYSNRTHHSVFGTGLNSDFQIGYHCIRKGKPLEILSQPLPIPLPLHNNTTKATKVSCGRAHTIIVTDKEGVFSLGSNCYGQCGCPLIPEKSKGGTPRINKVEGLEGEILQVFCGQDHTMFLTSSGEVYSCGWGADGQTGLGHYDNQGIPAKVRGDIEGEKVVQLSGAADCVLAVTEKGDVFGWGNSEYGQLNSVTDQQQVNIPRHICMKNIGKVRQVASGGTMCAVLSEQGNVHVWGYGILGQGPAVTHLKEPTLLPQPLFGLNEFNIDVEVTQITCGLSHFAAVTNKGFLYMWGRNRSNCLGLGRPDDQYFPYKISVPAEVKKVSCGVDHTAVICKPFA